MKEKIHKYKDIRESLGTFDILNCIYGTLWWNPLHWFMAAIGHTAMVYVCKETGQVMVYESTQMGRSDGKSGVQLRPMKEWLDSYPGKVYLRRVSFGPVSYAVPWDNAKELCQAHIKKYRGTKYPNLKTWWGRWFLANAAIDLPWKNKLENPDIDTVFFCTHLFFHVLRWCGILKDTVNPAEAEPDDTRQGGDAYLTAYLSEGITVGPEIRIK